jgi:Ca2+:H+ antiporter
MKNIRGILLQKPIKYLLVFVPLAIVAEIAGWAPLWIFIFSAIGVIPLAGYIGEATEALANRTGPKVGGLLNATLGNAAEMIITLVAIREGFLNLVKASITGSILGNLLLVMGFSLFLGGVKNGDQHFDRKQATSNAILLTLSVLALAIPSIFSHAIGEDGSTKIEILSLGVAGIIIVLYILGLIYSLKAKTPPLAYNPQVSRDQLHGKWTIAHASIALLLSTIGVVLMSELLVGAVDGVVTEWGLSEFFLGIILIPLVGNVAEHLIAVQAAMRDHMDLSIEIALSSSLQIALFVAPLLVFISLILGNPLTLIFNQFELVALGGAVLIAAFTAADGESNWLEGAALIAVYLIMGLSFFFLPA